MTDHGYTPTRQEVAKRDVAVQAERSWWVSRLKAMSSVWREDPPASKPWDTFERAEDYIACADEVDRLIAERES